MELSDKKISILRCPKCLSSITKNDNLLICLNNNCKSSYPVINGIPILINEENSIFRIKDFIENRDTTIKSRSTIKRTIAYMIPNISNNIKAKENYLKLTNKLISTTKSPKVLILGSGIKGKGTNIILNNHLLELYETDVSFGPRAKFILDAHDIPFVDEYFDAVIIQAVLEHVVDPFRCVREIHRVLKTNGFVYAETPFMQQVHEGKYDFHRFTHLGHRRLFRNFIEIESGATCGPGMALAWAYSYFLYSFFPKNFRKIVLPFAHFTSFFLKYFDYYLINKPGTFDAASGYYFWGQKSPAFLTDKELLKQYRGLL